MKSKLELIRNYNNSVWKIINSQVQRTGSDKSSEPEIIQIQRRLKLSKPKDWAFICTALETISDTSYAIENFVEFKIDGPTKYDNYGENFLRLYGFLNAVYIQQNVIYSLSKNFHAHKGEQLKNNFDALEITEIRHKIASHNAVYLGKDGNKDTFITGELLSDTHDLFFGSNLNTNTKTVNLLELLNKHIEVALDAIDQIFEKLIDLLYKNNPDKKKEFCEDLRILRIEKDGGHVIRVTPDGPEHIVIITPEK